MPLQITADPEGKRPLEDLGDAMLGEEKEIPFWVRNSGDMRVIKLQMETTYPEAEIEGNAPAVLFPEEAAPFTLVWRPGKKTLALAKKKEPREGEVIVKALEVIE